MILILIQCPIYGCPQKMVIASTKTKKIKVFRFRRLRIKPERTGFHPCRNSSNHFFGKVSITSDALNEQMLDVREQTIGCLVLSLNLLITALMRVQKTFTSNTSKAKLYNQQDQSLETFLGYQMLSSLKVNHILYNAHEIR